MYKIDTTKGPVTIDENFTGIIHVSNSEKQYWENGKVHRVDGQAIVYANGDKFYYQNNMLHRENGPAIDSDGSRYWYVNGERHRLDGPAVILPGGYKEYWIKGRKYTKQAYRAITGSDNEE